MGLPEFPDLSGPADFDIILRRLLESIALEELALAAIINSEAEKVQMLADAEIEGILTPADITGINQSVVELLEHIATVEENIRAKAMRVLAAREQLNDEV